MKNLVILMTITLTIMMWSCTTDSLDDNGIGDDLIQKIDYMHDDGTIESLTLDEIHSKFGHKEIVVEKTTIEELNKLLISEGLEPISQKEYDGYVQLKHSTPGYADCQTYIPVYGDLILDDTISARDLLPGIKAIQYCADNDGRLKRDITSFQVWGPCVTSRSGISSHRIYNAGLIGYGLGDNGEYFDDGDLDSIRRYILGLICN